MRKCPAFQHYEERKHVKSFFHENFWEVSVQTTACETRIGQPENFQLFQIRLELELLKSQKLGN